MDDKTLFRLSLAIAIIGIVGLIVTAEFSSSRRISINGIDNSFIGQNIEVNGTITSVSVEDKNIFFDLSGGNKTINVVMFERNAEKNGFVYNLKKGSNVVVIGKVQLYKNRVEIIAGSIRRI